MALESGLDLLLVLLYAPGSTGRMFEEITDSTRLVKLVFLLLQEREFKRFAKEFPFEAHDYGPWAGEIFDGLQTLEELELLAVRKTPVHDIQEVGDDIVLKDEEAAEAPRVDEKISTYSLSGRGKIVAKRLFEELTPTEMQTLVDVKGKFNDMPLHELLRYVYMKFPMLTSKSKIKEELLVTSMFGVAKDLPPFTRDEEDFRG